MASTMEEPSLEYLSEYNGHRLKIVAITFIVVDTICLALRFVSRRMQRASFGVHDIIVTLGWAFIMALCACALLSLEFGVGYHIQRVIADGDAWKIPYWGRNNLLAIPILYLVAVTLPKVSILTMYLHIMTGKFSRASCWILIAILLTSMAVNIIFVGIQCFPMEKAWSPETPGHCHDIQAHYIYSSIPNIVTDVALMILPIPTVLTLKVARSVKVGLMATFLIAGVGLVTAILRLVSFIETHFAPDVTYNATQLDVWIIVESSIYLICACLLTYRSLLAKIMGSRFVRSIYHSSSRRGSGGGRKEGDSYATNSMARKESRADSTHLQLIESKRSANTQSPAELGTPTRKNILVEREWFDMEPALPDGPHAR